MLKSRRRKLRLRGDRAVGPTGSVFLNGVTFAAGITGMVEASLIPLGGVTAGIDGAVASSNAGVSGETMTSSEDTTASCSTSSGSVVAGCSSGRWGVAEVPAVPTVSEEMFSTGAEVSSTGV